MRQDIKVDIVYYMTATDFEFEFNLGGCCHMRLLNDKVKDKKSFVSSLARAVSRSNIIISCGPLFGEDGLINIIASAIGKPLETIDNKMYGIDLEDKIEIISGSVPLVTTEGIFGGCIIESGDQSIIILTENRGIRKSIMKTLVHPYIEDISMMKSSGNKPKSVPITEMYNKTPEEDNTETAPDDNEDLPTDEANEIYITESEDNEETETEEEKAEPEETDDGEHNLKFDYSFGEDEPSYEDEEKTADEITQEQDNALLIEDDEPKKKNKRGLNISIIIVSAVLLLLVLALAWFLVAMPYINGVSISEYFNSIFGDISAEHFI